MHGHAMSSTRLEEGTDDGSCPVDAHAVALRQLPMHSTLAHQINLDALINSSYILTNERKLIFMPRYMLHHLLSIIFIRVEFDTTSFLQTARLIHVV